MAREHSTPGTARKQVAPAAAKAGNADTAKAGSAATAKARSAAAARRRQAKPPASATASRSDTRAPRVATVRGQSRKSPLTHDVVVAGVRITHPERVLYPEIGITKLEIAEYYARMAPHILRYVRNRPLSLVRCPQGPAANCFFQKHATDRDIPGIGSAMITESGGEKPYVVVNTAKGLAGLAQMNTLELHAWTATAADVERADMLVFDLDPDPALAFSAVTTAALECRAALAVFGLESYAKTTGGKGLHVVVPLARRVPWDTVKPFAREFADYLARQAPERYLTKASKADRRGRIFIDYLRNARGATAIAPYSVRARDGATVAVPLHWSEVNERLEPASFNVRTVEARLARDTDPWAGYRTRRQTITVAMRRQLARAARP